MIPSVESVAMVTGPNDTERFAFGVCGSVVIGSSESGVLPTPVPPIDVFVFT